MARKKKYAVKNSRKNKNRNKHKRSKETVEGIIQSTRSSFAFLIPSDGSDDVFIPAKYMGTAMNGDRVTAILSPDLRRENSRRGKVSKVLERNYEEIVGTFEKAKSYGFVVADDPKLHDDIFVHKRDFRDAQTGDKVVCKITRYPSKHNSAEGKITEIIGSPTDPDLDVKSLIRSHGINEIFPRKVLNEAKFIPQEILDIKNRRDLRDDVIFTIDGADSKDFDDAVSIKKLDNGNYLLGVHIADVTAYVKESSYLDKEAFRRGTSIYLIDTVVPMLPVELSNGICSLNEGLDRFTLSVDMEVNANGTVVRHDIYESVINSFARLIYDDVSDLIEHDIPIKQHDLKEKILLMNELAVLLRDKRNKRGSIDFDLEEAVIELGADGIPVDVALADRRSANKLIEEFMLLANEVIAEHFFNKRLPFVYRVHERPEKDKMEEFNEFISGFGKKIEGDLSNVHPIALNELLSEIKGDPMENVVTTVLLRSMKKAYYSSDCLGHFGLALKYYCHFTSPIRRYPDLMIHRVIKEYLTGKIGEKRKSELMGKVNEAAEQSSKTELSALELEREYEKMKKAEYMSYHLGEEFDAIISGVTSFGFFAELENTIEGLISINDLTDDEYIYERANHRLKGRHSGNMFTIGDKVTVQVVKANSSLKEIDFALLAVRTPK